ncbi:NAD(P)-dependent oxidoreductase [Thomasclavelia sp.]|uniref:NAD-dependent epimerase/dehydratase family protein n=1 Tax=Thomasclavelia sp. TaxID=3025757 RepID=UPI0025EE091E|nr:NAD(P)-dependent oxidoreductase [Thomasclavelia sp.]
MESVLVTGAGGFIGFNLVSELIENYQVYALIEKEDTRSRQKLCSLKNTTVIDDFSYMLANPNIFPSFQTIYHLATVGVRPDFSDISLFCDINIKMGCQLVDFAVQNKSGLLVNFGSCFEYGNHGNKLLSETDECYPESLYAISKNTSVKLTTQYAKQKGISLITVRPFGVFGAGEGINRLAPSIIYHGLKKEVLKLTAGEQIRDFVNVEDVVKSIIMLANSTKKNIYDVYNICSSNPVKVKEFVKEIIETCGFDEKFFKLGALHYRKDEAMIFAGNNDKLLNTIEYDFPDNHTKGIKDIFEKLKKEVNCENEF